MDALEAFRSLRTKLESRSLKIDAKIYLNELEYELLKKLSEECKVGLPSNIIVMDKMEAKDE